jgi:ABC-type transport system involved in cytochrome bd biosynthesis fused ATPase/permease subunit
MNEMTDTVKQFFGVAARGQTYLNIIYLLLSFPPGTAYFVFLVTGLLLGISLLIIWVGIPILLFMLAAWWGLVAFERQLAIWLQAACRHSPDVTRDRIRTERMSAAQNSPA